MKTQLFPEGTRVHWPEGHRGRFCHRETVAKRGPNWPIYEFREDWIEIDLESFRMGARFNLKECMKDSKDFDPQKAILPPTKTPGNPKRPVPAETAGT